MNAGGGSRCRCRRGTEDGPQLLHAAKEQQPIDENGEQKVGTGARGDDCHALQHGLGIEGPMPLMCSHLPLPLVQHLYVAAQRKGPQGPFGTITPQAQGKQGATKPDGEAQHLHTAPAGHAVVAKFVDDD